MRLPVTPQTSTKDGISNKNARITNVLTEQDNGVTLATVRPGLVQQGVFSGNGKGLVNFNEKLLSMYEGVLYQKFPAMETIPTGTVRPKNSDNGGGPFFSPQTSVFEVGGTVYAVLDYTILSSPDGIYWDEVNLPVTTSVWRYGGGMPGLLLALDGLQLAYSTDAGQTWTASASNLLGNIASDGSVVAVLNYVDPLGYTANITTDGVTFNQVLLPEPTEFWAYFQGVSGLLYTMTRRLTAAGEQYLTWSVDSGATWETPVQLPVYGPTGTQYGWRGCTYNPVTETFHIVGASTVTLSVSKTTKVITEGVIPESTGYPLDTGWVYVRYESGGFYAVGFGSIARSADFSTWAVEYPFETPDQLIKGCHSVSGALVCYNNSNLPPNVNLAARYDDATINTTLSGDFFDFAQSTL